MKKILGKVFAIVVVCVLTACVSVNAAAFVNSVEQTAPSADGSFTDDSGNTGNVIFTDENGNTTVPEEDVALEVTDLSQVPEEELEEVKEMLENAEAQIAVVESVTELTSGIEEAVNSYNQANSEKPNVDANNLVVLNLFDVSLVKSSDNKKESIVDTPEGSYVTFDMSFPYDLPEFYVLIHHEQSSGEWKVESNVEKINKRTLRCTVNGLSPFALLVDSSARDFIDLDTPREGLVAASENENTIESNSCLWILPVIGAAVAAAAFAAVKIRKKAD